MNRPIVFFDLETTGVDTAKDKIVEIYCKKLPTQEVFYSKINPEMEIPQSASDVHHITNEDVAECPKFREIANELMEFIKDCDLAGYNSIKFDVPMRYNEFDRLGMTIEYHNIRLIDACNIFRQKEAHTLSKAVEFYLNENHEEAHAASADVEATIRVFNEQVRKYGFEDLDEIASISNYGRKILDLSGNFTFNENQQIIFTFGKWKNEPVKEHYDYLNWMMKSDFPEDTKLMILDIQNNKI
jgi:DNA polymerase-3 subunit epsilon